MVEQKSDKKTEQERPEAEAPAKQLSVEELTDLLKRTQANFENYRKQSQTYLEDIKKMAARDILLQVLPVLDNFELALKAVSPDQANTEFVRGVTLIHAQLLQLLQHNNVVPLETIGKNFDPYYHEALMRVPSGSPANKIIEEFQKGFTMHGKVLRHAKVKVSAGINADSDQKDDHHKINEKMKNKNEKTIGGQ
ncbi:MAG: nucleotide exchange factor GrpE [Nanoarchaeota archaeon]|nr:nucleotide exchange factor GrpE [Nanoarchaeota archaeon]